MAKSGQMRAQLWQAMQHPSLASLAG